MEFTHNLLHFHTLQSILDSRSFHKGRLFVHLRKKNIRVPVENKIFDFTQTETGINSEILFKDAR